MSGEEDERPRRAFGTLIMGDDGQEPDETLVDESGKPIPEEQLPQLAQFFMQVLVRVIAIEKIEEQAGSRHADAMMLAAWKAVEEVLIAHEHTTHQQEVSGCLLAEFFRHRGDFEAMKACLKAKIRDSGGEGIDLDSLEVSVKIEDADDHNPKVRH